ncbi:MAG: TonB-dependent receptor [Segetibacter sp.]|nr:TonB-dependent receptor [Segetibacter sp.]
MLLIIEKTWREEIPTLEKWAELRPVKVVFSFLIFFSLTLLSLETIAQYEKLTPGELKKLSVEELMNLEVTLVSRSPQKLAEAASAVQVITGEDIRNSGATNIAEALRLVTNLQVAQLRSNIWLISSRGFNQLFANKLLVMIDGRTVYTPLFAGVFWDMQNVLLEDVDKIEVVSGPGGTLWGANAVNGVINIITKNSAETQGLYASALAGTFIKDHAAVRWGGKIGKKISYKVYGQHFDRNSTKKPDGTDFSDAWKLTQGGFRMDWNGRKADNYTVQGDYYGGTIKTAGSNSDFNGQNILGRWSRNFSEKSDLTLQLYYDRYFKQDAPGKTSDKINTADVDFQYRFPIAKRHSILSGLGYRMVKDEFISSNPFVAILPQKKSLDLFNAFIQNEIAVSDVLKVTAGTKVLHNVYTGIEVQPGIRMALTVKKNNTLWAAVSRAVRTPSRIDVDYFSPVALQPPTSVSVTGGPTFKSEKAFAYELGYRIQPNTKSSFSIASFYNVYKNVYSLEALPGTLTYQIFNGSEGKSWGSELSGTYQLLDKWRVRGGYTYFDMKLKAKPGHTFDPSYLANDVQNQAMLQSMTDLPFNLHLDVIARYLDYLPQTITTVEVPGYFTFDTRIAYTIKHVEVSVAGQNLYKKNHTEYNTLNIPRSIYAKLTFRL